MASIQTRHERGFSLLELLVATSLLLVVIASVFQAMHPAYGSFHAQPEMADLQQRLRVATDTLARALLAAGGGMDQGSGAGPLNNFVAPVLPLRQGRRSPDAAGTFKTDTLTVLHIDPGATQTTIAQPLAAQSSTVHVNLEAGCPPSDPNCGFKNGMSVIVFDETGAYDTFTITSIDTSGLHLQHNTPDAAKTYPADVGRIAAATSRTYYLKADPVTSTYQLMQYDGAGGADAPVVDHVVGLWFEYFGDPEPPVMRKPLTDPVGPWTTYGPKPPASGDNCVFVGNGSPMPSPGLPILSGGPGLVRLTASDLTDGPWCPDAVNPNRFDADLLRLRTVAITLRVEATDSALRGPAGALFTRGGTASGVHGFVPDQQIRFEVAPRNLNLQR
jgi:prepilin-type N-terminal cleavage/methylation domain-containing protein